MGLTVKGRSWATRECSSPCGYAADLDVVARDSGAGVPGDGGPGHVGLQGARGNGNTRGRCRWSGVLRVGRARVAGAGTELRWVADVAIGRGRGTVWWPGRRHQSGTQGGCHRSIQRRRSRLSPLADTRRSWPEACRPGRLRKSRCNTLPHRRRRPWGDRLRWQPRTCRGDKPC